MIIEEFLELPPFISFQGVNFHLEIFGNGGSEARIGYTIQYVDPESPHKAEFDRSGCWANVIVDKDNPPFEGFLILFENIETDVDLIWAMRQLWFWVQDKGFLGNSIPGRTK